MLNCDFKIMLDVAGYHEMLYGIVFLSSFLIMPKFIYHKKYFNIIVSTKECQRTKA